MRLWLCFFLGLFIFDVTVASSVSPVYAASRKAKRPAKKLKKAPKKKTAEQLAEEARQKEEFRKAEADLYARKTSSALPELTRLCEAEYLRACSMLGFAYVSGRYGVREDFEEGVRWYQKCADKENNFFCHNELGRLYYRRNEFDKAFDYYRKRGKGGKFRLRVPAGADVSGRQRRPRQFGKGSALAEAGGARREKAQQRGSMHLG